MHAVTSCTWNGTPTEPAGCNNPRCMSWSWHLFIFDNVLQICHPMWWDLNSTCTWAYQQDKQARSWQSWQPHDNKRNNQADRICVECYLHGQGQFSDYLKIMHKIIWHLYGTSRYFRGLCSDLCILHSYAVCVSLSIICGVDAWVTVFVSTRRFLLVQNILQLYRACLGEHKQHSYVAVQHTEIASMCYTVSRCSI